MVPATVQPDPNPQQPVRSRRPQPQRPIRIVKAQVLVLAAMVITMVKDLANPNQLIRTRPSRVKMTRGMAPKQRKTLVRKIPVKVVGMVANLKSGTTTLTWCDGYSRHVFNTRECSLMD